MSLKKVLILILASSLLCVSCLDQNDGPAEKAGEAVDQAVEDAGDAVEEAADHVEEAADDAADAAAH